MKLLIWLLLANFILGIIASKRQLRVSTGETEKEVREDRCIHPAEIEMRA